MMGFTDIHCHLLPGVDDGARDTENSRELIRLAWAEGIRNIVFTPHVRRPWLDRPWSRVEEAFENTKDWARERYPDLNFFLGSEFAYSESLITEQPGQLHDLGGSGTILLEFKPGDPYDRVLEGVQRLQMAGYDVLIAHVERCVCLVEDADRIARAGELGAKIQVNADSITGPGSWKVRRFLKKLLDRRLIDCMGTDAHDTKYRRPRMQKAYEIVKKRTDEAYAERIFRTNALNILKADK